MLCKIPSSFSSLLPSSLWYRVEEEREEVVVLPYTHCLEGGKVEHITAFCFNKSEIQNTNNRAGIRIDEYKVITRSSNKSEMQYNNNNSYNGINQKLSVTITNLPTAKISES